MKIRSTSVSMLTYALPGAVGGSGVTQVDIIVCDIVSHEGLTGFGFSYAIGGRGGAAARAASTLADEIVAGASLDHPEAAWRRLRAACNRTGRGPNFVGLAAVDLAIWDLHSRSLGIPLGVAMGGTARTVPGYGSGGYRPDQSPAAMLEQVARHDAAGFRAVKLRLSGEASDIETLDRVRAGKPTGMQILVDMNEKGRPTTALALMRAAASNGGRFVEEPLPCENLEGYRALARAFPGMTALGEHLQGADAALPFLRDGLCSIIQPDLAMMGGMTECLRLTRAAELFGVEVMPHFLPGLFVHLAAASPSVSMLEEFPLLEPVLDGLPAFVNGVMRPAPSIGHGLSLKPEFRDRLKREH